MEYKVSEEVREFIFSILKIVECVPLNITLEEAAKINSEIMDIRSELTPNSWGDCVCH